MRRGKGPRKAGDVLKALIRANPTLQGGLRGQVAKGLMELIDEILPEEAGEHCFFHCYSRGIVTIGVDASVYHHELQCYFVQEFLEGLRRKLPQANIHKVRFKIVPRPDGSGSKVD